MKNHIPYGPYEKYFKRPLDVLLSSAAIIALSPVLGVTALIVKNRLGSPVLFIQDRVGKDEKIFKLYKFRSMTDERDAEGNLLSDKSRLTRLGRILRTTSLDELPELFNILKGDMSIVGPRPLLVSYLPYYTERERHRHDVRPGLTGLAQVRGRSFLTWEEIFGFDLDYIRHCSFAFDASIVLQTFKKVLSRGEIADVQTTTVDKDGTIWVIDNGEKKRLHRPLNEEREQNAKGDRQ